MKPTNPFPTSGYYGPAYFCDRQTEIDVLSDCVEGNTNLTLFASRRLGKTGLIQHFFHLNRKKYIVLYFDIQQTQSMAQFVSALAEGILRYKEGSKSFIKKAWELIKTIRPVISYDSLSGEPSVSFTFVEDLHAQNTLKSLLSFLEQQNRKVVIAIDEFQQITEYDEPGTEALLRSAIQQLTNVVFIFSGSKKHLITEMFASPNRPFYQSTRMLPLGKIDEDLYVEFAAKHFSQHRRKIEPDALKRVMIFSRRHTFYTQMLLNRAFLRQEKKITEAILLEEIEKIFGENQGIYEGYSSLLTSAQWKVLKAIASEEKLYQPQSQKFINRYQLGTAAGVGRIIKALIDKDLILKSFDPNRKQYYEIQDVFLSRWLEHY